MVDRQEVEPTTNSADEEMAVAQSVCRGVLTTEGGSRMLTVTRSPELEEFAREGRRRFEAGDSVWFEQTTAAGEVSSFGTAPDEQSRGRDAVLALTGEQTQAMNESAGLAVAASDDSAGEEDL